MKLKNAINMDIVELNKSEIYLEDKVLPEDCYKDIYISQVNNMETKKKKQMSC